jgi:hypothetical protein
LILKEFGTDPVRRVDRSRHQLGSGTLMISRRLSFTGAPAESQGS